LYSAVIYQWYTKWFVANMTPTLKDIARLCQGFTKEHFEGACGSICFKNNLTTLCIIRKIKVRYVLLIWG
jgi:hypothetical protein